MRKKKGTSKHEEEKTSTPANNGALATAADAASTQGENRARRSSLHGINVLIVHTRSHRRRQKRERERERERERKADCFFSANKLGKYLDIFFFLV
jgi:hypothetical protein